MALRLSEVAEAQGITDAQGRPALQNSRRQRTGSRRSANEFARNVSDDELEGGLTGIPGLGGSRNIGRGGGNFSRFTPGFGSTASEDSDQLDILGLGLNAKRDIRGFLGLEGQKLAEEAANRRLGLIREGINEINRSTGIGTDALIGTTGQARGELDLARERALASLFGGLGTARQDLFGARDDINRSFDAARDPLSGISLAGERAFDRLERGSTASGFRRNLEDAASAASPLIQERERAIQRAQAATGLSRSGAGNRELADVSQETIFGIEGLLNDRTGSISNQGLQAMNLLAQLEQARGQNLAGIQSALSSGAQQAGFQGANLETQQGQNLANILTALGSNIGNLEGSRGINVANLLNQAGQGIQEGVREGNQARSQGLTRTGNVVGNALSAVGGLFSDSRLKKNIEVVGNVGPLDICTFEANEEGKRVGMCMTIGLVADQVKKFFPQFVGEKDGYMTIFYQDLLEELDAWA